MSLCPRCRTTLNAQQHGDISLERCERCGGYWMSGEDLKTLVDLNRAPAREASTEVSSRRTEWQDPASCWQCGLPLEAFTYAGDSGVVLDKCPGCGKLWLDAGELERVVQTVSASENNLDRDVKRFSADFHQAEVRQEAQEQRDTRPLGPVVGSVINEMADSDPNP
ncbi:MAG TPA: zf-TFIIB domain-containing protein [Gemmataceae bacterium]|nr:zf-TFIIB domain-containing protein [Gemmataceae bacterium]